MDYFNYYTITGLIAIIALSLSLVWFAWLAQYQYAGTPYPPLAEPAPDRWELSDEQVTDTGITDTNQGPKRKCRIPGTSEQNAGTIHTDDATYASLVKFLPGARFGKYDQGVFVPFVVPFSSTDILEFPKGNVYIDFSAVDICTRKLWANTFNVVWDGVSNYNYCNREPTK